MLYLYSLYPEYIYSCQSRLYMAEASVSKGVEDLDKEITCPVCQEHFEDPRLLPCGHFYCRECIDAVAGQSVRGRPFLCPECRKPTRLPQNNSRKLPTAFFVNRMKEIHSTMIQPASDDQKSQQPSTSSEKDSKPKKPHKHRTSRKSAQDPPAVPTRSDQHRHPPRQPRRQRTSTSGSSTSSIDGASYNPDQRSRDKTKNWNRLRSSSDSAISVRDIHKKPRRYDSSRGHKKAAELDSETTAPFPPRSVSRPKPSTVHTPRSPPSDGRAHHPPLRSTTSQPAYYPAYSSSHYDVCTPSRPYHPPRESTPPQRPSSNSSLCRFHDQTAVAYCYDCCRYICDRCSSTGRHDYHRLKKLKVESSDDSWGAIALAGAAVVGVGALAYGLYQLMKPADHSDSD